MIKNEIDNIVREGRKDGEDNKISSEYLTDYIIRTYFSDYLLNLTVEEAQELNCADKINNNESSGDSDEIDTTFTYEVDSNQALKDWANNASGNDYSAVLIRKGTWTSTVGVNLTEAGTKVVVGEAGSKLVFNDNSRSIYGLYYSYLTPTDADYWMRDVTIECTGTNSDYNFSYSFHRCTNLSNCTVISTGTDPFSSSHGFSYCTNLANCTGTGSDFDYGYGFYYCTNLTNCKGTGYGTGPNGSGYGFYKCTNLTNCTGTGNSFSSGYGFHSCTNLTNCNGTGTGTANGYGRGFHKCNNLTNCTGTGYGTASDSDSGCGFSYCTDLTNCTGTSTGSSSSYIFYMCKGVSHCKEDDTSSYGSVENIQDSTTNNKSSVVSINEITTRIRKNLEIKDYDNCETLMLGDMPIACRSETEITTKDGDYETIRDGLYIFYPRTWFTITNACYRDELLAQKFNDLLSKLLHGNISIYGE